MLAVERVGMAMDATNSKAIKAEIEYLESELRKKNDARRRSVLDRAWPGLLLLGIGLGLLCVVLLSPGGGSAAGDGLPEAHGDRQASAVRRCRIEVVEHLLDPASARWIGQPYAQEMRGGWEVTGGVVASNRLGAMTDSRFRCRVIWVVDRWRVLDLSFENPPF